MRHFNREREAFLKEDGVSPTKTVKRVCTGCGSDFAVRRPWQKHCSPRCCQRAYVERLAEKPVLYYGA